MDYYQPVAAAPPGGGSPFVSYEQPGDHPSFEEWRQQQEAPPAAQPVSVSNAAAGLEDAMWGLSLQSAGDHQGMGDAGGGGGGGGGPYPERPGEQDCVYYMRTGLCAFGMSCKFNHPPNRKLAAAIARGKGEYPERPGQPECQYFLKTGTCKFGSTCKYDHPRDKAGIQSRVQLNIVGLPYRPGEKECAYYMRTGSCKYGVTCKFHHPQPAVVPTSAIYAAAAAAAAGGGSQPGTPGAAGAATGTAAPQYQPGWPPALRPFPSPRLQAGASSYTPLLLPSPQGVVSIPWGTYHDQQLYLHGASSPTADYSPFVPGSPTMGLPAALQQQHQQQREQHGKDAFPERPGVAECQYYLKTGDCKYGASCRFHHPRERMSAPAPTMLSPMGLPLRTGVQPCSYYIRFGICKFGPTCKFDHPLAAIYGFGPSSPSEIPPSPPSIHHVGRATLVEIDEHHHHHIAGSSSTGSLSSTSTSAGGGSAASSSAAAGVSDPSATLSSTSTSASASSAPPPSSSSSSSAGAAQRKGSVAEDIVVTSAGNSSGSQAEI